MSRLTTGPTLAATTVVLAGLLAGCGGGNEPTGSSDATPSAETSYLELTVPTAQTGRCMPPNVKNLQAQDTAFEGVVTGLEDGTATLDVTESFRGKKTDTAHVAAPSKDLQDLLLAVDFEEGETYLVSSLDGQVSVCGLSGHRDELLSELYEQAYRG